jgi:Family of unknown function (DUF5682)
MAGTLSVFGIRHHGPGSARVLVRALDALGPTIVLVEGPPDAASVIEFAAHADLSPPVALLIYEPDAPSSAVYYPFANFSPEWQALRWALDKRVPVRFIDLPQSLRRRTDHSAGRAADDAPADAPADSSGDEDPKRMPTPRDALDSLAIAAGFPDGEAWWSRLIEERHGDEDPLGLFEAIHSAMLAAREELGGAQADTEEPVREAYMRKSIRASVKEGFERIAVVCGAWHAPVLTAEALARHPAKQDDRLLKGLPKRKTAATWIPWTHDRLCFDSGYGAGVASPGWYEHIWRHRERLSEGWMIRVARLLRDEDIDASPASVIESVRLADSLAAIRGRRAAGLEDLSEATLAVLCHGNPMPMRLIHRKLVVGQRLGRVPDAVPMVPLQRDLAALQRSLRLAVSADETILDLDQRKENDLARSRLLHRLRILGIDWGELQDDQRQRISTFHEIWKLQWRPEFAVKVIEAAQWGNTVADAAAASVAHRATNASDLGELAALLDDVILADLPGAVERLLSRIQSISAVSTDIEHLMTAFPPLARVLRYGNVRKTDAALVEPVVASLLVRISVGLLPACTSLDDDAAALTRQHMDGVNAALANVNRPDLSAVWKDALLKVGDAEIHGLVAGRAYRILVDSGAVASEVAADRLSQSLSHGNDPGKASAWLEGFLSGSGLVLVHDERLLGLVDAWLTGLSRDTFERICPIARRTFSTFEKGERRQIGERLKRAASSDDRAAPAGADDYDPARGALVEPIFQLILGDRLT